MRGIVTPFCVAFFVLGASAQDLALYIARERGALAKECLHVVDQDGLPVADAMVWGGLQTGGNLKDFIAINGCTNTNGEFIIQGKCTNRIRCNIMKAGYYNSEFLLTNYGYSHDVKDGKWHPYGESRRVVLKKIKNPQKLVLWDRTRDYTIPVYDIWFGFDFERYQFVAPYGEGKNPDVLLRFTLNNPSRRDYHMKLDVSFTNMPYAGAYVMKKDEFSDFKNVYHADTNANYRQTFAYSFDRYPQKRPIVSELGEDEYLVFRTRTKVDDKGRLLSANYGVLYGPWSFVGPGGMKISFLAFNPTPNDTNLEDIETVNKMKRMRRR